MKKNFISITENRTYWLDDVDIDEDRFRSMGEEELIDLLDDFKKKHPGKSDLDSVEATLFDDKGSVVCEYYQ